MNRSPRLLLAALVVCGVTGCDQGTKLHAVGSLTDAFVATTSVAQKVERFLTRAHPRPTRVVEVLPGLWDFRYIENTGAAFNFLRTAPRWYATPLLLLLPLLAMAFLGRMVWKSRDRWLWLGAAVLLGGGLGNALDRVRLGYVIDFVHWHWGQRFDWPVFNVADAAVAVGIGLLLWRMGRDTRRATPAAPTPG